MLSLRVLSGDQFIEPHGFSSSLPMLLLCFNCFVCFIAENKLVVVVASWQQFFA